jgi:hypothetical protein
MTSEMQKPQQSTPKEAEDLTLNKETLKDLKPGSDEQDKVRGGAAPRVTSICR